MRDALDWRELIWGKEETWWKWLIAIIIAYAIVCSPFYIAVLLYKHGFEVVGFCVGGIYLVAMMVIGMIKKSGLWTEGG